MNQSKYVYYSLFAAILLAVTFALARKPYYNWDIFPYMALALSDQSVPFSTTHRQVYAQARSHMPAKDFEAISGRQILLKNDPEAFHDILKYFEIKPGYNLTVKLLHQLGFDVVTATYAPSIAGYLLIGCLIFWVVVKVFSPPFALVLSLLTLACPFLTETARYSTPDMLSAAILFSGILLLCENRIHAGLALLLMSVFVRPDNTIFLILLGIALFLVDKINWKVLAGVIISGCILALWLANGTGVLMEFLLPASALTISISNVELIEYYFAGLRAGVNSIFHSQVIVFVLISTVTLYVRKNMGLRLLNDFGCLLIWASLATFLCRYLLHPIVEDRFNIACYLLILMEFYRTSAKNLIPSRGAHNN